MIALLKRLRGFCYVLAGLLCAELVPGSILAEGDSLVKNVHFEVTGELVRVYYDLLGPKSQPYRVSLTLHREGDPKFIFRPDHVMGDANTVIFPGEKRRITWDFFRDFPDGLQGNDFYFTVEAQMMESPGGLSPLYWIGGGVAVLGGVLAIVLLSKGENSPPTPAASGFPSPPGRPQ